MKAFKPTLDQDKVNSLIDIKLNPEIAAIREIIEKLPVLKQIP